MIKLNSSTTGEVEHTKVSPPYLRLVSNVNQVNTYDLRLSQPNISFVPSDVLHSLEHLFNVKYKVVLGDRWLVAAPLGCATGFWMLTFGVTTEEFEVATHLVLNAILKSKEVPLCSVHECGNYRNHNLDGAKEIAQWLLDQSSLNNVYLES